MKACIFQKQEPVNIPQIETATLTDVLALPWGFEIYGLLTRWNPLDIKRPHALPYNGKNVLVVGLGPAGYTLAHHLTAEGFAVAAIDGLKIEPLPVELTGDDTHAPRPIKRYKDLELELDERILLGFGGVSEYGITIRWDKNFLTVLYITLARQRLMRMYGGVRFGGAIDLPNAWNLGFDHVAIAAGAGRPTIIPLKNNLARGIRKASDFLMGLQLTGAYKRLEPREPPGAPPRDRHRRRPHSDRHGDGAARLLRDPGREDGEPHRHAPPREGRGAVRGSSTKRSGASSPSSARTPRPSGRARPRARRRGESRSSSRSSTVGRRLDRVPQARDRLARVPPQPRGGHQEPRRGRALHRERGARRGDPRRSRRGEGDGLRAPDRSRTANGRERREVELPARTLMVAAGTSPNVTYEKENPEQLQALDKWKQFFAAHKARVARTARSRVEPAPAKEGFFTSYTDGKRCVSYYGDNHPHYAGSVVKAMASAKDGYPHVVALFRNDINASARRIRAARDAPHELFTRLDHELIATVARRAAPHPDDRRGHRPRAPRPPGISSRASSTASRTSNRRRARRRRARASPWRASPSPARGSTRSRA
jgi:hypothetical protein